MLPTIVGIMTISFVLVQFAPGGPVERIIAQLEGTMSTQIGRMSGMGDTMVRPESDAYRGAQGLDPAFIAELEAQFGFDKPAHIRFVTMLWDYARFEFGTSYYRDVAVLDLIAEKLPCLLYTSPSPRDS